MWVTAVAAATGWALTSTPALASTTPQPKHAATVHQAKAAKEHPAAVQESTANKRVAHKVPAVGSNLPGSHNVADRFVSDGAQAHPCRHDCCHEDECCEHEHCCHEDNDHCCDNDNDHDHCCDHDNDNDHCCDHDNDNDHDHCCDNDRSSHV